MSTPAADPITEGAALFNAVWAKLVKDIGLDKLCFPKHVVWLNGAPGAGKGTNTPVLMRELKITAQPVVTSDLLTSPECQAIKASGGLVDDTTVAGLLFKKLLEPQYRDGVMIDGFPRTRVQAECVRLFRDRLAELSKNNAGTPRAKDFPAAVFRFVVLQVTEQQAVERQLKRGREVIAANEQVKATGKGQIQDLRPTDTDPAAAAKRYRVFCDATVAALESMKGVMNYHLIDATGDIPTVQGKIVSEFRGKV
jgi:adenylate kinase